MMPGRRRFGRSACFVRLYRSVRVEAPDAREPLRPIDKPANIANDLIVAAAIVERLDGGQLCGERSWVVGRNRFIAPLRVAACP
jgi:hypothetical protein